MRVVQYKTGTNSTAGVGPCFSYDLDYRRYNLKITVISGCRP